MPENLGQAVLKLKTDSSQFDKGMKSAETRAQRLSKKFSSIGKRMSAAVTLPIAGAAVAAGKAASDLEESMNAVNVVFGESAGKIEAWGETAAETAGIAQAEFNQAATTLGSMLQNVGMSADEAAEKSINLTQRAADMASVFNTDVDQALGAIQAGIRGEIDPLERFGVSLNMASVKAHAVEEGMAAAGEELTAAQKTTARLSLIMEQTNDVAGDFANTSDQTANSFRQLKAETIDVAAELGQQLLPMFNKLIDAASSVVDWLGDLSESQRTLLLAVSGAAAVIGPLAIGIGAVTSAVTSLIPVMGTLVGILTGPAGIIVAATAAAGALALMTDRSEEAKQGIGGLNNAYSDVNASLEAAKEANKEISQSMSEQEKHARRMMRVSQIHEELTGDRLSAQKQITSAIERQLKAQEKLNNMRAKIIGNEEQLIDRLSTIDKLYGKGIFNKQEALNKKIEARQGLIESIQQRALERGRVLDVESEIIERMRSNIERYRDALEGATEESEKQSDNFKDIAENLPKISETMGAPQPLKIQRFGGEITGGRTGGGIVKTITDAVESAFSFIKNLPGVDKLAGMVMELSNVVALMNPLQTMLEAVMDVIGPIINNALQPLVDILTTVGESIGKVLVPLLKTIGIVINGLATIWRWAFNNVFRHVFNVFIMAANLIANAWVGLLKILAGAVNWIPGVNIPTPDFRSLDQGTIGRISGGGGEEDTAADVGTGGGGSEIDQARPITVNVDIYDNELAGEDGFRELAVIIRNELESLGVINA